MAIKLVVTDLDGTLLDRSHVVSADNISAVRAAVRAGVTVTIATGRMYASALPYARELGVDVPIITYNGAMIKSVAGEVLFERCIEPAVVGEIFDFCREKGWYIQAYCGDQLYFADRCAKAKSYERLAGIQGIAAGKGLYDLRGDIPKMLIITSGSDESDAYIEQMKERFGKRIFATKSNPDYIEIVDPNVNKAVALQILMDKLGVQRDEVMAIGDSNNDVPMLKHAGLSVAMDNASDSVKALCDFVTDDCARSGVAAAIEKYVLRANS